MTWRGSYDVPYGTSYWLEEYGEIRNRVLDAVELLGPCSTEDVTTTLGNVFEGTVRRNLSRLVKSGDIARLHRGRYAPISSVRDTP